MGTYRILPGLLFKFKLQRRVLGIFWAHVSSSDLYDALKYQVEATGGVLLNRPTPPPEGKE